MVYKLAREAEKRWRRLDGSQYIVKVLSGVRFIDGEVQTDDRFLVLLAGGSGLVIPVKTANAQPETEPLPRPGWTTTTTPTSGPSRAGSPSNFNLHGLRS